MDGAGSELLVVAGPIVERRDGEVFEDEVAIEGLRAQRGRGITASAAEGSGLGFPTARGRAAVPPGSAEGASSPTLLRSLSFNRLPRREKIWFLSW